MSNNPASDTDIEAEVQQFTSEVEPEVVEALQSIDQTVEQAGTVAAESMDVVGPVADIVRDLAAGRRAVAIESAISMLSDDTRTEAREAIGALKVLRTDVAASVAEAQDVVNTFDDEYAAVEEELSTWFDFFDSDANQ